MKKITLFFLIVFMIGITGCGYKDGVMTPQKSSYLYFTGNIKDVKVTVDDGEGFSVEPGKDHQYKIESGKHTVSVYRNNALILKRDIFVSDEVAKEIQVQP